MFDIAILRLIWWALLGIVIMGFAITDGFDFGAAALLPYVARTPEERRTIFAAIGPFWEGNQVWIILGAGAIFAAWPLVYAVAFSGFYFLILLLLLTMGISRPVTIKYRSKVANPLWQLFWDAVLFIGGVVPAIIFGLLIGNVMTGAPFYIDTEMRIYYMGEFNQLFSSFAWLCGLTSLFMLMMHGALYLILRTRNPIRKRAIRAAQLSAILFMICFAIGGFAIYHLQGLHITSGAVPTGYSNPLTKTVAVETGAWLNNFFNYPLLFILPALGFAGAMLVIFLANTKHTTLAFLASCVSVSCVIGTVGVSLFPFILPSSYQPNSSLLVWDASSNSLTLLLMLVATVIFLPIILFYTAWVYRAMGGKVMEERELKY